MAFVIIGKEDGSGTVLLSGYSSVGRAIDCRSIGHLFESGCSESNKRMRILNISHKFLLYVINYNKNLKK